MAYQNLSGGRSCFRFVYGGRRTNSLMISKKCLSKMSTRLETIVTSLFFGSEVIGVIGVIKYL